VPTLGRYNDWLLIAYPGFIDQYARLSNRAREIARSGKPGSQSHPKVKKMAALRKMVFEVIPSDPASSKFLLGNTLGPKYRAWRRAKFGGQYRLFFRFDIKAKIIIYGWLNDEDSRRAYGSKTDAYAVFGRMLDSGSPPSTWTDLLGEAEL
jgi:toxin YhaV